MARPWKGRRLLSQWIGYPAIVGPALIIVIDLIIVAGSAAVSSGGQAKPNLVSEYPDLQRFLDEFNADFEAVRNVEAEAAWNASIKVTLENQQRLEEVQSFKETWRTDWCEKTNLLEIFMWENHQVIPERSQRQLDIICRGPQYNQELSRSFERIQKRLYEIYTTTLVCFEKASNRALFCEHGEPDLARRMKVERDPATLESIWLGWHNEVGTPQGRQLYRDMVSIMNQAARNSGYHDIGQAWRDRMALADVEGEAARLFQDILPLYKKLHAFVRHRLHLYYGPDVMDDPEGLIPAHILGNLWGQTWSAILDIVAPSSLGKVESLTTRIQRQNLSVIDMVKLSEDFYMSMGFEPMTDTFWKKSQFVHPWNQEEPTSCHPSALDMYKKDDYRIEMCGEEDEETFFTVHHEMGHVQYYMNYAKLEPIFRDGASPAFHEAVGDAMVYAVQTPEHIERLGLQGYPAEDRILRLLRQALDRLPLIAWSLVVDKWRWDVFAGRVPESQYNNHWWFLRDQIQGLKPPAPRTSENFDPMAKFHIPDNSPYIPYFFSSFLQVQLLDGMCKNRGSVNLDECDIYGNKEAGSKLRSMMMLGQSRSWQEALYMVTGQRDFSSRPILDYFRPLDEWLDEQITSLNLSVGW